MSVNWPPGRSEAELLARVQRRAQAIRTRRRAAFAGAGSAALIAVAIVGVLVIGHHPSQSVSTADQAATSAPVATLPAGRAGGGTVTTQPDGISATPSTGTPGPQSTSTVIFGTGSPPVDSGAPDGSSSTLDRPATTVAPAPGSNGVSPPQAKSVSPRTGPLSGGTSVTITGIDLDQVSRVYFGTEAALAFRIDSPTEITALSPPASHAGTVTISLFDKDNGGGFDPACLIDPGCGSNYTYTGGLGVPSATLPSLSPGPTTVPGLVPGLKAAVRVGL